MVIFAKANKPNILPVMYDSSACGAGNADCLKCPKAVDNLILYASHSRGFHFIVPRCDNNIIMFLLKGEALINSKEYAGVTLHAGEFILQAVGSKYEVLAMTDVECVCYRFSRPESFCEGRYRHIVKDVVPPLIFFPLKICSELNFFLEASKSYLAGEKICRELLQFKQKELAFILWHYYSDYELSMLVHSLSEYTDSFQYFVLKNYDKVKTVEEFAELGGYTATTFRRIFTSVFHRPVYEWMQERRKEGILYELRHTDFTISEICYKYGFESLPHFSNFCKKNFGLSPRSLRKEAGSSSLSAVQSSEPLAV